jgi:4-hydroxybenzoate polyprenyltransferase
MNSNGFLKIHKWWTAHYCSMMTFGYLAIAASSASPEAWTVVRTILLFTAGSIGIASTGQLLNDLGDIRQDSRTGAPNILAMRSVGQRILIFVGVAVLGILPWFLAEIILFALYSLPPFRLKGRGLLGPITDSLYGYVVTHLVTILVFLAPFGAHLSPWLIGLFMIWWFVYGFAQILHHQLLDESRDRTEGIQTLAVRFGWERTLQFVNKIVVPFQVCAFVLLMVGLLPTSPLVPGVYLIYLVLSLRSWQQHTIWTWKELPSMNRIGLHNLISEVCITAFVKRWLPWLALANLIILQPQLYPLIIVNLLFFPGSVQVLRRSLQNVTLNLARINRA